MPHPHHHYHHHPDHGPRGARFGIEGGPGHGPRGHGPHGHGPGAEHARAHKRERMFEAGELDLVYNFQTDQMKFLEDKLGKDQVLAAPDLSSYYYVLDTRKPPFDDARVRAAFSMAVGRIQPTNVRSRPMAATTRAAVMKSDRWVAKVDGVGSSGGSWPSG